MRLAFNGRQEVIAMKLHGETIDTDKFFIGHQLLRANVPGRWFITTSWNSAITFYPDPHHEWDGNSLP
jgi:hypothetical protein